LINGRNIKRGDLLVGFPSNGLHTNGYSLARKVLLSKYSLNSVPKGFKNSLGSELLRVHRSYLSLISTIKQKVNVKGFSHITGGGIVGNTLRILPKGLSLNIFWDSWTQPKIFKLIQSEGEISDKEMRSAFNLGIGLVAVVSRKDKERIIALARNLGEKPIVAGEVI